MKEIDLTTTTETIYIGLKDKNENKLYLGDIVSHEEYNPTRGKYKENELIVYTSTGFDLLTYDIFIKDILIIAFPYYSSENGICHKLTKIGNLRENPELLRSEILEDIKLNENYYNTGESNEKK